MGWGLGDGFLQEDKHVLWVVLVQIFLSVCFCRVNDFPDLVRSVQKQSFLSQEMYAPMISSRSFFKLNSISAPRIDLDDLLLLRFDHPGRMYWFNLSSQGISARLEPECTHRNFSLAFPSICRSKRMRSSYPLPAGASFPRSTMLHNAELDPFPDRTKWHRQESQTH